MKPRLELMLSRSSQCS